jgi:hypothetical protein
MADATPRLNGADYVATVRLTNKAGDLVFADAGETCERVPPRSLPWLLEGGQIQPVEHTMPADAATSPVASRDVVAENHARLFKAEGR